MMEDMKFNRGKKKIDNEFVLKNGVDCVYGNSYNYKY